jgi:hypothetical protein
MPESKAGILIMKAAAQVRRAAAVDKTRETELLGVADYLESIVHETELGYGEPLFPDTDTKVRSSADEVRRMIKPFRVRLTR